MARGRKPADVEAVDGVLLRQRIYSAMRFYLLRDEQRERPTWWTQAAIANDANADPAAVQSYLLALQRCGYVVERREWESQWHRERCRLEPAFPFEEHEYKLTKDYGVQAPRVTRDGRVLTGLSVQEAVWRAARVLRRFTWVDLAGAIDTLEAPPAKATIKAYLADLHAAGYLKKAIAERPGVPAVWALRSDRDSGPLAPLVQRSKVVFDRNTGSVVHRWSDSPDADAIEAAANRTEAA